DRQRRVPIYPPRKVCALHPQTGRRGRETLRLARILLPPLTVLVVGCALLVAQVRRLLVLSGWVDHTDATLMHGNLLYRRLVDQEDGLRGYLMTGEDEFLEPYRAGHAGVRRELPVLEAMVADQPHRLESLERLRADHAAWESLADAVIGARPPGA